MSKLLTNLLWIGIFTILFGSVYLYDEYKHPNQKLSCQYVNKE